MRFIFLAIALCFLPVSIHADSQFVKTGHLLTAATGTGAGSTIGPVKSGRKVYQASVTGTGAVTATVLVQVSTDATQNGWITMGTITLSGTTTATDGFVADVAWPFVRGNVSAVTGTGATVYLTESRE